MAVEPQAKAAKSEYKPELKSNSLVLKKATIQPPLDPGFCPFVLGSRSYMEAASACAEAAPFHAAVERHNGLVSAFKVPCFPPSHAHFDDSCVYVERKIKFLLWQRGGFRIHLFGEPKLSDYIARSYSPSGERAFDVDLMKKCYKEPFEVRMCERVEDVPAEKEDQLGLGGNLDGNRIGFDLGGSDFKLAAVKDGDPFYTTEIRWDPYNEPDPQVHWDAINKGLAMIKEKLDGKVDAIGGSSAGVLVDNEFRVASLFRSVPEDKFESLCRPMMRRLEKEWGVPVMCINDGEVTALAGGQSLGKNKLLGVAMGTSTAVGYLDGQGKIRSWLNELAFAPVDFSPAVENMDEWSKDVGVGCMYFSQQAVNKLAKVAGFTFSETMKLPERLVEIQSAQKAGDARTAKIYESIGVYLGYTVASYAEFYPELENVMILGRVTTGTGGDIMLEKARHVLSTEFPELKIELHTPDERMKRVGQSVAAASLPVARS